MIPVEVFEELTAERTRATAGARASVRAATRSIGPYSDPVESATASRLSLVGDNRPLRDLDRRVHSG